MVKQPDYMTKPVEYIVNQPDNMTKPVDYMVNQPGYRTKPVNQLDNITKQLKYRYMVIKLDYIIKQVE